MFLRPTVNLISKDHSAAMLKAVRELTRRDVLVGVPRKTTERDEGTITNAALAYIHDNGSPLAGIPPRPFLKIGIMEDKTELARRLQQVGEAAMNGKVDAVERGLNAVGLEAQKAIRRKITVGPFTPLKPATIRARSRRHKGRKSTSVTPLVDTGALRQAINYTIRKK